MHFTHLFVCHLETVILTSACHVSHLPRSRTFLIAARHSDLFLPELSLSEDKSQRTATRTLVWPFLPNRSRSQLPPPRGDHQTLNTQVAGLFGRLAPHCPLTGYKPNAIVEIGIAEVTSTHRPSRRTSFCSVFNSCEDVTSARVSSEVDGRQSIGRLAPTAAHCRREKQVQSLPEFITLHGNLPCHVHHTFQAWRNLLQHTDTNGSRAETREAYRRNISQVKELDLNHEKLTCFLKCRADDAVEGEQEALSRLFGAEFHTGLLL